MRKGGFIVGQQQRGGGRQLAVRGGQQAQRAKPQVKNVGNGAHPGIKMAVRPRLPQNPPQQGLGGGKADGAILHCQKCGKGVTPKIDAMFTEGNEGPFCPDCWVDLWVEHPWANRQDGPPCRMGVRFSPAERAEVQGRMWQVYSAVAPQRRFPTMAEMDGVLGQVKKSYVCPTCRENIAFNLEAKDFKIAGVTPGVPWPQGMAFPWDQLPGPGPGQVPGPHGMAGHGQVVQQHGHVPQLPGYPRR